MKKSFSAKTHFLKLFLPLCALIFYACNLLQETPNDFLEDYASIAQVTFANCTPDTIPQGAWRNVGSDHDFYITYFVENPGNHRLRAEVAFSDANVEAKADINFPENNGLLHSWIEFEDDGAGNITSVTQTETETNFLLTYFTIRIPQSFLQTIDGDVGNFNISPTVTLFRSNFGMEERPQSSYTLNVRCNTPPAAISDALGQMIVETSMGGGSNDFQILVLAITLPTLKPDDMYLTVSENGRSHVFVSPFTTGTSTDGLWTISSAAPTGMEATYTGGPTPTGANCFITTDINIKGRAAFEVAMHLTDQGGLSSPSFSFASHGAKLLPPTSTSSTTLDQDEADGMARYVLSQAESGTTIHYTATQTAGGSATYSGSGASPLAIPLPAGTFDISAYATKSGFIQSDAFTQTVTVNPSVFFVSANGSDTTGDGSKSKPFATIWKAATSFVTPSGGVKIFLLSNLTIETGSQYSLDLFLQGCAGGNKGSRVTISFDLTNTSTSGFLFGGDIQMHDLNITQPSSAASIASGIMVDAAGTLELQNVAINGIKTTNNAASGALVVNGTLNIAGGVNITGNTAADGSPRNVYLPTGKTVNIQQGSLAGTQIGVFTADKPTDSTSVAITSGYNGTGGYGTSDLSHIASDESYGLKVTGGEVVLVTSGGSIEIIAPASIKFSFCNQNKNEFEKDGDGKGITIYAFDENETELDYDDFTTCVAEVWLSGVSTGKRVNLKQTTAFDFEDSWDSGDYTIKVASRYGGTEFSGTLTYHYTKP